MKTMVISIRNTAGVRCREVVRISEGPLWEVRLYSYIATSGKMLYANVCRNTWALMHVNIL